MNLKEYRKRRQFDLTPEPRGSSARRQKGGGLLDYVVQKHMSSHLHYDFRLEWRGVLLSWALPKGPSLNPAVKRLAMQTEDHPLEYAEFEGVIPYGSIWCRNGNVWDRGTWEPENPDVDALCKREKSSSPLKGQETPRLVGPGSHPGLWEES